jgi:hypothetical protein
MVETGPETRNVRLSALMERAQNIFKQSRRLVEESQKITAEAEAKRLVISMRSRTDNAYGALQDIEHAAE